MFIRIAAQLVSNVVCERLRDTASGDRRSHACDQHCHLVKTPVVVGQDRSAFTQEFAVVRTMTIGSSVQKKTSVAEHLRSGHTSLLSNKFPAEARQLFIKSSDGQMRFSTTGKDRQML